MSIRKPTAEELAAAVGKTLPDVIAEGLSILFCGINPSLYTAVAGHHFARPGNRFWPALYRAGFTPRLLDPSEERLLLEYGYGITNIVPYATASEKELSKVDLLLGGRQLEEKVRRYTPKVIAVLGIGAYRKAFSRPKAAMGRQKESIAGVPVQVLPNPSGLNAHYQIDEIARMMREIL